jgi:asparagine synthase (glutamine-hydrolysing)
VEARGYASPGDHFELVSGLFGHWHVGQPRSLSPTQLAGAGRTHLGWTNFSSSTYGPITLAGASPPRSHGGTAPRSSQFAGTACVFDGRLDNRNELLRILNDHPLGRVDCDDAQLAIAAYERFGDRFVEHLDGDFSIGVFDSRLDQLLLARDRLGVRPLCYSSLGDTFRFASDAKSILASSGMVAVPDDAMLADFMLSFSSNDLDRHTFFAGIHSVPAGHLLVVTSAGVSLRRYFDFDTRRTIRLSAWSDYVDGFHHLFVESVRKRLRSAAPVAIAVSGGLDSAYIFCVAHALLRLGQAQCPGIRGFNYAGQPGTPSDEESFVRLLEQGCGARIERVPQRPGFMEVAGADVWCAESPIVDGLACQAHAALGAMRDAGTGRLLTGHWGDQFLFDSDYLLDLFHGRRWRLLAQHLRGWGIGATELAARLTRSPAARLLPGSLKVAIRGSRSGAVWNSPWFTVRFRRLLRDRAICARASRPPGTIHARAMYRQARMPYHVQCMEWNTRIASARGIDMAFPYLDANLIEFLMAIPGDVQSHDGVPRGLMRAAMRRVTPKAIVDRHTKGEFTHLANATIEHDFDRISRLLDRSALSIQYGYVDGPVLQKSLQHWRATTSSARDAVVANRIAGLCGFELFLREFFAVDRVHSTDSLLVSAGP